VQLSLWSCIESTGPIDGESEVRPMFDPASGVAAFAVAEQEAVAFNAGTPPRWAYSTLEPAKLAP